MRLPLLALLLLLPAFFAAAEVSSLRLRPSRVDVLVEEGKAGAASIHRLQRRLRRALMLSQFGATLALVALGWAGRGLGQRLWPDGTAAVAWLDLALFLGLVLLATLLAGLLPKAWVLSRPEPAALRLAPLLEMAMRCLSPLLNLLEGMAAALLGWGLTPQWINSCRPSPSASWKPWWSPGASQDCSRMNATSSRGCPAGYPGPGSDGAQVRDGDAVVDVRFAEMMEAVHHTRHARFPVIGQSLDDVRCAGSAEDG